MPTGVIVRMSFHYVSSRCTLSRRIAIFAILITCTAPIVIFSGCSLADKIPGKTQLQNLIGDKTEKTALTVGDLSVGIGMNYLKVESIGLANSLNNSGGSPPTGIHRSLLIDEMLTHDVENPGQLLDSPNTSLVLARGYLPPGVRKGDHFDIEVRLPAHSNTTSLRDGWLLRSRMREIAVLNQSVHSGHVAALADGPVLVRSVFRGNDDSNNEHTGLILGGGISQMDRPLGLVVKSKHASVRTSTRISSSINKRFLQYHQREKSGVANAQRDNYIELSVHASYRNNVSRYMNVINRIAVGESVADQRERKELLLAKLLEPTSSAEAALQLEAIGKDATSILQMGIQSSDPEVQFYSAEALAYLGESAAAPVLTVLADTHMAFRWHALTALAGMDHVSALDGITELMESDSAETRYGAFTALWKRNPGSPLVSGMHYPGFTYHHVASTASPMIHVSMAHRAEIVVFGNGITLTPQQLIYAGKHILIKNEGVGKLQISCFTAGQPDRFATTTTSLEDVVRGIAKVGGGYSEIVDCLQAARNQNAINARILIGVRPRPVWSYNRDAANSSDITVSNPMPEMFFNRLGESKSTTRDRNSQRVQTDNDSDVRSQADSSLWEKSKSWLPSF
jgi:flagellar basal body P-ring protein FlgI